MHQQIYLENMGLFLHSTPSSNMARLWSRKRWVSMLAQKSHTVGARKTFGWQSAWCQGMRVGFINQNSLKSWSERCTYRPSIESQRQGIPGVLWPGSFPESKGCRLSEETGLKIEMVSWVIEEYQCHWSLSSTCTTHMCTCTFNHTCAHTTRTEVTVHATDGHSLVRNILRTKVSSPSLWFYLILGDGSRREELHN